MSISSRLHVFPPLATHGVLQNGKLEIMEIQQNHELMAICDIACQKNVFRLLVHSLVPGIYGHETVKGGSSPLFLHPFSLPPIIPLFDKMFMKLDVCDVASQPGFCWLCLVAAPNMAQIGMRSRSEGTHTS